MKTSNANAQLLTNLLATAAQSPAGQLQLVAGSQVDVGSSASSNDAAFMTTPTLATLCGAAGLVVVLWLIAFALRPSAVGKVSVMALRFVDAFELRHSYADRETIQARKTKLGGGCTLLALGTIIALALSIVLQRSANNTLVQSSLLPLDAIAAVDAQTLSPTLGTTSVVSELLSSNSLPFALQGITVLVAAQSGAMISGSEPTCAPFATTSVSGLNFGSSRTGHVWNNATATTVTWISCAECIFSSSSELSFTVDFACQSFLLGVLTTDVFGSVVLQAQAVLAQQGAAYKSIAWHVTPLLQRLDDAVRSISSRGHVAFTSAAQVTTTLLTATTALVPNSAAVQVSVSLAASQLYASVQATQKQTIVQLVSSLVGLFGILGAFATLFKIVERIGKATQWCACKKKKSPLPLSSPSTSPSPPPLLTSRLPHSHHEPPNNDAFVSNQATCATMFNPLHLHEEKRELPMPIPMPVRRGTSMRHVPVVSP
jgi:hypothetical protein